MFKSISFIALFSSISLLTYSQSNFFKPIPKLKKQTAQNRSFLSPVSATGDLTFWAIRPIACAATIFVGGTVEAAAGAGISYQNITQRASDGRNYVNYAFSAVSLLGGSVVKDSPTDIEKFGLMVSALNNTVGLGPAASRIEDIVTGKKSWKIGLMVVWTYNFNN